MAIRFDNATERLIRTSGLPSFDANYTMMAWVYVVTHNGAGNGACVISIDDQTDDVDEFYISAPGASTLALGIVTLGNGDAQGSASNTTFSAGTWQHVCIVRSANNLRTGYRNGVSEMTHTFNRSGRTAPTSMTIGSVLDDDLLNGRIAHIKLWTEALTVAEIQQEIYTARPQRTADLHLWTPGFIHTDIADYSGNGRNWTAVGTLATEDGPPVAWGAPVWVPPFVPSAGAQSITPDHLTNTSTVHSPTVTGGAVTITPAHLTNASTVHSPTVTGGAVSITPAHLTNTSVIHAPDVLSHACTNGVLRQNSANGRYLENDSGPLVLTGFHTWYNLQDGGDTDPPPAFGWSDFKAALVAKGVNFTKLWRLETAQDWPSEADQYFGVQPWARTGPGNAADGKLKFDLDTFDDDYFERLRARCIELGNLGIYVAVQLFNGFHIDNTKPGGGAGDPWAYHPFEDGNNINSIDGDANDDGIGAEIRSTGFTTAYNYQLAFVEKVIDTINDLDNVLIEISNEDGAYSETWQKAIIDHIQDYEGDLPKQHPVGMTKIYPSGTNSMLTSSNADWISPDEDLTPVAQNATAQAWMYDTDHSVGITDTYDWIFRALCMGYGGAWYMDLWDSGAGGAGDTTSDPTYELIREVLGYAKTYAAQMDLENAAPSAALSSTGYCLAKTTGVYQFLVYQDGTGAFDLTLTSYSGVFSLEWLRISDGTVQAGSDVTGGDVRTLTPPWSGDVVAFLEQTAQEIAPAHLTNTSTVHSPTLTPGAVTIAPDHLSNTSALHSPTVTPGAVTAVPDHLTNTSTVHAVTVAPGAVVVAPDHLTNTSAVHNPTLTPGAVTIAPDSIASASTVYEPTVAPGAVTIAPDHLSNTSTVHEPTLTAEGSISPDHLTNTSTVHAVTVAAGAVTIAPDHFSNTSTFYEPAITSGQTVAPDPLTNTPTLHEPTLTPGAVAIAPDTIATGTAVYAVTITTGAVTMAPDHLTNTSVIHSPFLGTGTAQTIAPDHLLNTSQFWAVALLTIPARRVYWIATESRVYQVDAEDRVYTIEGD